MSIENPPSEANEKLLPTESHDATLYRMRRVNGTNKITDEIVGHGTLNQFGFLELELKRPTRAWRIAIIYNKHAP